MEAIPRKYGEWSQFDRYCKLVLYHEAIDYLREMKCRRDREVSLDAVSLADWDKLSTVDRYSCDSFTFSSHGYDLHIDNELVIDAACAGNAEAVERVLQHYDGYINKLCTRTLYDGSGQPHICIDEYMKRRLQIKLIHSIVSPIGD